jgi:hypothetical protein
MPHELHGIQGFARVELRDEDILCILRTLEYDGIVDCMIGDDGEVFRPARQAIPRTSAFTSIPCGVCPVRAAQKGCTYSTSSVPVKASLLVSSGVL